VLRKQLFSVMKFVARKPQIIDRWQLTMDQIPKIHPKICSKNTRFRAKIQCNNNVQPHISDYYGQFDGGRDAVVAVR
jgi:hypothetical protein